MRKMHMRFFKSGITEINSSHKDVFKSYICKCNKCNLYQDRCEYIEDKSAINLYIKIYVFTRTSLFSHF